MCSHSQCMLMAHHRNVAVILDCILDIVCGMIAVLYFSCLAAVMCCLRCVFWTLYLLTVQTELGA
jgi:hypothetical protein